MTGELSDPNHPYNRAPRGVWLAVGSPVSRPYPCRCRIGQRCRPKRCPCSGRTDLAGLPASCCAGRAAVTIGPNITGESGE